MYNKIFEKSVKQDIIKSNQINYREQINHAHKTKIQKYKYIFNPWQIWKYSNSTDYAGTLSMFYRSLKEHGITVKDIDYILATHYHPDHIGLVSELMEQGVGLILMESQVGAVHYSDEIFAREPRLRYKPIDESVAVLLPFEESRAFLGKLGIDGGIISTPSHSVDSVSVVLDEGICIVEIIKNWRGISPPVGGPESSDQPVTG